MTFVWNLIIFNFIVIVITIAIKLFINLNFRY